MGPPRSLKGGGRGIESPHRLSIDIVGAAASTKVINTSLTNEKCRVEGGMPHEIQKLKDVMCKSEGTLIEALTSFMSEAYTQHEFCLQNDGKRWPLMAEQFRTNLASADKPSAKWKTAIATAGLPPTVIPSVTELQKLDVFPSERSAAISKLEEEFGKHFALQREAHQILSNPLAETIAKWVTKHTTQPAVAGKVGGAVVSVEKAAEKATSVPLHQWRAAIVAQEKLDQPFSEAQIKEVIAYLNLHFSILACQAYPKAAGGQDGNIFVKNFDEKATVQKVTLVREGSGTCKLRLWGKVVTETVAKRLPRNTTMYLGDGCQNVPLYLDGSGETAQNSRCCVPFLIPPLAKDKEVVEVAAQDAAEQSAKKAKTEKPKSAATHEISYEPLEIMTSAGKFTYQLPILVDAVPFDEDAFNSVNRGACFRKRTALDDHQFPQEAKKAKSAPSFLM